MSNNFAVTSALGIWIFSSIPTVAAGLSWQVCTKNEEGKTTCRSRISKAARITIGIGCLLVLLLIVALVFCVICNRRRAKASEEEYNVEASQVDGPPTIVDTAYHPKSGPSVEYTGGRGSPEMSGPAHPVTAQTHYGDQGRTFSAPMSQANFPDQGYPFKGYSPHKGPSAPKTAYLTGGFPRPLLAGSRLKDRLKERPASVSAAFDHPS